LTEDGGLEDERRLQAEQTLQRLQEEYHYCLHCAREAITLLFRRRYAG